MADCRAPSKDKAVRGDSIAGGVFVNKIPDNSADATVLSCESSKRWILYDF